jgi:hypothetical protein
MNYLDRASSRQVLTGSLFLKNVWKSDYKSMEEVFRDRLLDDTTTPGADATTYDKIPATFSDLASWPVKTNLRCWECSRTFKGRPWFCPRSIEPVSHGGVGTLRTQVEIREIRKNSRASRGIISNVTGNFCTAHCAQGHIDTVSRNAGDWQNNSAMLRLIYEIFTGHSVTRIRPSPPRDQRAEFGGPLSDEEYQKKIESLSRESREETAANWDQLMDNYYVKLKQGS